MIKTIKDRILLLLRYLIGGAIVLWLFKTNQLNPDLLSLIDMKTVFLLLGLCAVQFLLCGYRVKLLLAAHHISVSFSRCFAYNAIGIYYSMFLPGGMSGDAVRAFYFWRCKTNKAKASKSAMIGALITDRLIGTLVLVLVGLLGATFSANSLGISTSYLAVVWPVFGLLLGLYCFLCGTHRFEWNISETSRFGLTGYRIKGLLSKLDLSSYPRGVVLGSILISIIVHVLTILAIFIIATRLNSGLRFDQLMAVAPVGLLVNAVPISPGGLGVGEKSFDILFTMIGGQQGANTFMLSRIFLFSPAILGALFSFVLWNGSKKQILNELVTTSNA